MKNDFIVGSIINKYKHTQLVDYTPRIKQMESMQHKYNLCTKCEISLSFSVNQSKPSKVDLKKVSSSTSNSILVEIMEQKHRFKPDEKFIILVDGSRYEIRILSIFNKQVKLEQYFLHYDGSRGRLMPTSVRLVLITL